MPNEKHHEPRSISILMSVAINVWMMLPLLMAIVRYICQRILIPSIQPSQQYSFIAILTDNFGVMLAATAGLRIRTRTDHVLRFTMSLSALAFSMTILSIVMYNSPHLADGGGDNSLRLSRINSLEDLARSNLTLTYLRQDKDWIVGETKIHKLFQNISNRLHEVKDPEFFSMLGEQNATSAYVMPRSLADVCMSTLWLENGMSAKPVYRLLKEKLGLYMR